MVRAAGTSLRLVDSLPAAVLRGGADRQREVASANRDAAKLPELTAQALFAANVRNRLEGGRAAVLPADSRRRLIASAVRLGIKEFDAHLIIAMVQSDERDGAGRLAAPAGPIATVSARRTSPGEGVTRWTLLAAALALAGLALAAAIAWVR